MPGKHAHVASTLTRVELEAPFSMAQQDPEPLPSVTRLAVEWDGRRWSETDPASGYTLSVGSEG